MPSSNNDPTATSSSSSNSNSNSLSALEPPWSGWIETTGDALIILEAARRGLIPRVTRRLIDTERKMITSGSVFVFDEEESSIKRWTDGLYWSASRILGNFLLYRETDKRGAGHKVSRSDTTAEDAAGSNAGGQQQSAGGAAGARSADAHSLSRPRSETSRLGIDRQRERSLVGSLTNSDKFKQGGMVKKTFSLTINGVAQHMISYYKIEDIEAGRLRAPSSYPELAALDISPEFLDKTHFRLPPRVEIGFDGIPRYRGDADEVEPSPHVISAALGATPLLSEPLDVGAVLSKRGTKRYEPYATQNGKAAKRRGNGNKGAQGGGGAHSLPTSPATDEPGPFSAEGTYALDAAGAGYVSPTAPVPAPAPQTQTHQQQQQQQQTAQAYATPTYGIAPSYNYGMGYGSLPASQAAMLPPPTYQPVHAPSTASHHTDILPPLQTQSLQAAQPQPQPPALPLPTPPQQHQQAYSPSSLDGGYYPYYATSYAYGALPAYPHPPAQHFSAPASGMSEKTERVDVRAHTRSQSGLDVALSPIVHS